MQALQRFKSTAFDGGAIEGVPARLGIAVESQACAAEDASRFARLEAACVDELGRGVFEAVYEYLQGERGADFDEDMRAQLLHLMGGDESKLRFWCLVDQLIYHEEVAGGKNALAPSQPGI